MSSQQIRTDCSGSYARSAYHTCLMVVLQGGRAAHKGQGWGIGSGEGPSVSNAPRHTVKIHNHHANQELDVEVPEDRYVFFLIVWLTCKRPPCMLRISVLLYSVHTGIMINVMLRMFCPLFSVRQLDQS